VTAALSLPADARTKKKKQNRVDPTPRSSTTLPRRGPSLDGAVLGRERTCGHATFVYDGWGYPWVHTVTEKPAMGPTRKSHQKL
jgi:hypothetical protein